MHGLDGVYWRERLEAWVAAGVLEKVLEDLAEPRDLFDPSGSEG